MKVLLMVNSTTFSDSIKSELEKKHYQVDVACDDKNGLEMVMNNPGDYGLILMDWALRADSSNGNYDSIRKEKLGVPVVYLTGKHISEAAVYAFKAGTNDFVRKPLSLTTLLARLSVLLKSTAKQ